MHPAKSVIFFTTASGAGYGLIVAFFIFDLFGLVPYSTAVSATVFVLAFALIIAGLLSSTFHLGHPERAWRAVSQWRSSWLSREGVMAIITFAPAGFYGLLRMVSGGDVRIIELVFGALAAVACALTVYCTAMIYASLKPVRAWSNGWTPLVYLILSMMTGMVLLNAIACVFGFAAAALTITTVVSIAVGLAAKFAYWSHVDNDDGGSTPESATGLGSMGKVRLLEAPHSEANYLMKEMVFRVARKHAARLRKIAIALGFIAPLCGVAVAWLAGGGAGIFLALLTTVLAALGVYVERWLFFAEARHTVGLYYGKAKS